jgi:hypothetical protein
VQFLVEMAPELRLIQVFVLGGVTPVAKIGNVPAEILPDFDGVFKVPASAEFNIFVVYLCSVS